MKTYTKTIEETKPRLVIKYDNDTESPREWSNLGYFITCDSRHSSPDRHEDYEGIIRATGDIANSVESHMAWIKKEIKANCGDKVLAIYPVTKYEHGGIVYRLGTMHGFDCSNNGFYIVTDKSLKASGYTTKNIKERGYEAIIKAEIDVYNKWVNGNVYWFELFDENGDSLDSCGGYYSLEDIRHDLPAEWKNDDLSDYLVY